MSFQEFIIFPSSEHHIKRQNGTSPFTSHHRCWNIIINTIKITPAVTLMDRALFSFIWDLFGQGTDPLLKEMIAQMCNDD